MDILLILLGAVCLIMGIIGCLLPVIPGVPLAFLALLLLQLTDKVQFSTVSLFTWLGLVILVQILDYIIPALGTRFSGGGKWGSRGCMIGTVAGLFVFPPWGIIIGPFIGALIGELLSGQTLSIALKSGFGAFVGFVAGTVVKFILCVYFVYIYVSALL